jgi:hypothetical protein
VTVNSLKTVGIYRSWIVRDDLRFVIWLMCIAPPGGWSPKVLLSWMAGGLLSLCHRRSLGMLTGRSISNVSNDAFCIHRALPPVSCRQAAVRRELDSRDQGYRLMARRDPVGIRLIT